MEEHTFIILGERVLIHTISCATIMFERSYIYKTSVSKDSNNALHFILNNSGLHSIIDTFGLTYNGDKLTYHFIDTIIERYGRKAKELVENSSISTIVKR